MIVVNIFSYNVYAMFFKTLHGEFRSTNSLSVHDQFRFEIRSYRPRTDETVVKKIAMQHMSKLMVTYDHSQENYERIWRLAIRKDLDDHLVTSKVCTINNVPVAFMNYAIYEHYHYVFLLDWMKKFMGMKPSLKPHAYFAHLAVDNEYQAMGFGTALFAYALNDCKEKSVEYIFFETTLPTSPELKLYYQCFGFNVVSYSSDTMCWARKT